MSTSPSVTVTLGAEHWKKVSELVREHCRQLSGDWQKWGNQLSDLLQSSVNSASPSGSAQEVSVVLTRQNWSTVIDILGKVPQRKGTDWTSWCNAVSQKIQQALEGSGPPPLPEAHVDGQRQAEEVARSAPAAAAENRTGDNGPIATAATERTQADLLYEKGWKAFFDAFSSTDAGQRATLYSKAQGYLTMAYKAAGDDTEDKKGIAGLMAVVLNAMEDRKNAEPWARAELAIDPTNVFARLALYEVELEKLVGHKGFVTQADGSGFGTFASMLTTGVDIGRVQSKKTAVKNAAIEAAKALDYKARTSPEPSIFLWLLWSWMLLSIIENMWNNGMKEPYLCNVLLNLPWNRFGADELKELAEPIEEIQVSGHGFLARMR